MSLRVAVTLCAAMAAVVATPAARVRPATAQIDTLAETVSTMAAASDSRGRREVLQAALSARSLPVAERPFDGPQGRPGTNVEVALPGTAGARLLLTAHYDRVPAGRGVVDNAAACAALVELLGALRDRPLDHVSPVGVFFDLEEGGLHGSRAWLDDQRNASQPLPDYAINLDIFAYGDAIFATASDPEGPLASSLARSVAASPLAIRMVPRRQYPASDHLTLMDAGIDTIGVALLDAGEIDPVLAAIAGRPSAATGPPRILSLIHSDADVETAARLPEVARGVRVLDAVIRAFDAALAD